VAGFILLAGFARLAGAQAADTSVLRRNPISMFGLPGFVQVPMAAALPSGTIEFTADQSRSPS